MFNGCTRYELWDIDHLSGTASEHRDDRGGEKKHCCSFWPGGFETWKQINISAGAGRL